MRDKDVMRRAVAAAWGALLLAGAIAWAVHEATLLDRFGGGPRWYRVEIRTGPIDQATLRALQTQLAAAAAAAPAWPMASPGQAVEPESATVPSFIVRFQGRLLDGRRAVALTGNCFDDPFGRDMLDWRIDGVLDGGDCIFEATFDPASGLLERFFFHGRG